MRVVIPIVAGVGNALLAVPMVRQLKRHHPEATITIIARLDAMAEIFRRLPEVDEALVAPKPGQSVKATRARTPDLYIVPFPSNRWQYSLLQFASGARRRLIHGYPVGYWQAMHFLPGERVPAVRGIHDVVQNLNLLRRLGIEPDDYEGPTFAVNDSDRKRADKLLAGVAGRFIAVHAGSAKTILAKAKRWPTPKYAAMIDRLNDQVVLLEGPDESGVAEEIIGASKRAGVARVKLDGPLGDAAAVLERAMMYVGSDSGLAHLSAAVGTPAVTMFAPADPDRVSPFGNRHLVVQPPRSGPGEPCAPCFLYPWEKPYPAMNCREPLCINDITVDAVVEKIDLCRASLRTSSDHS